MVGFALGRLRPAVWGRLACERGTSLTELLSTLAILGLIVGALTTMFTSASTTQRNHNRRLEAQQDARGAVVRMRRELHCASGVTATAGVAVSSFTATLPAVCFGGSGADVSVTYQTASAASGRWRLQRVQGATTITVADYLTSGTPFTYSPPTAFSLGNLRLQLPVDLDPSSSSEAWRLHDDIVLRNTFRA
jgi:Tfp pilus assembly protein PilW